MNTADLKQSLQTAHHPNVEEKEALFDDIDVNSNKLGATVIKRNEKLVKLLDGIGEMKLGEFQDNTIDAFGDAYEFLMSMYASNAGKSGGEFFTPQEVSEIPMSRRKKRIFVGNIKFIKINIV